MAETTASETRNESSHDGGIEPATKVLLPSSVAAVAAVVLLIAGVNFIYSVVLFSGPSTLFACLAFFKGLMGIAAARGLLNLRQGWRCFVIIVTGLSLPVLPFYFLAIVLSSELSRFVSELSGIESRGGIAVIIVLAFALSLWMCRTLLRQDVERAFRS